MESDWQHKFKGLKERNLHLLKAKMFVDCHFLVGDSPPNQKTIAGHKLILTIASPVFERMFYGQLADKNERIVIPDIQPVIFQSMLEHIYSDCINIVSMDMAFQLYSAAKKYMLRQLLGECTLYINSHLSPKNVCQAYEFAEFYEEPGLKQNSLKFRPKCKSDKKNRRADTTEIASSSLKIADQSSLQNKTSENRESFCDISIGTLASVDSLSGDSCSISTITTGKPIIKIEEEFIQEDLAPDCTEAVEPRTTFELNSDDDITAETTSTQNSLNQPFVEPSARSWKNIRGFKEPNFLTDTHNFRQRSKKKTTPHPDDENTSSSKNEHFKQWVYKKHNLLELEVLEMRNYKMKLELWEKEQELNVKSSKYTIDIEKTQIDLKTNDGNI